MTTPYTAPLKGNYKLKNVLLETGYVSDERGIKATKTELFCIEVNAGKITKIFPNDPKLATAVDAKGYLMLPAFSDMHVHLDKTLYGLPWQAQSPKKRTVLEMIAYEQEIIPELLQTSTTRAEQLIDLLQRYGTTFARTHFNVDTTSGFRSLENLQKALDSRKESFNAELVAFPQHGFFYTDSAPLMEDVAQMDHVAYIGGVDPYGIDKNIEKVLDYTVKLALDNNKGIDIHLHDGGKEGIHTIEYLAEQALQNPKLQGRTFVSHAFVLAQLPLAEVERIAEKLATANVGIVSSIPFGDLVMPIPTLLKHGVEVLVGNDNVQDYWSTFGPGNMLAKANLMAEIYGWRSEFDLSRTLRFATHNTLPLDEKGNMQWPKTNDSAEFVLIDASCSAEAVSRVSPTMALAHTGALYWKK
ncbi:amidohydrolase [Sphingobacterium sp. GVS05A]|uniref:amidohydrolase n=1 Tax=Sphingobacterium sp. GVS05A TaxID=2862679 RepID=UPI001CC0DD9B|nr:amidohydrolase [Sphingobacterium sp. GVS05A]